MNISVLRNNAVVQTMDFAREIEGIDDGYLEFFMGRSDDCHLVLDDMKVSREHAKIIFENGKWKLEKLSDISEVKVNGSSIDSKILENGDVVVIGPFTLNIELPPQEVIASAPVEEAPAPDEDEPTEDFDELVEEEPLSDDLENEETPEDNDEFGDLGEPGDESFGDGENETGGGDDGFGEGESEEAESFAEEAESEYGGEGVDAEYDGDDEYGGDGEYGDADGGYGDDDYAMEEAGGDGTMVVQSFAKFELELFGEHAPYDKFTLTLPETYIGRDPEKCQIVLNDPEVSSVHAVIRKSNINCMIEDLQSGNGTLLNGERINKEELTNGDEFIIGATTFTVHIGSDLLQSEQDRLMPVDENQVVEVEEIVEVSEDEGFDLEEEEEPKSLIEKIKRDPKKRKMAIFAIVGLLLLMMLDDGSETKKQDDKKKKGGPKTLVEQDAAKKKDEMSKKKLSQEDLELITSTYLLGKELYEQGKYREAIFEFEKVNKIDPDYKETKALLSLAQEALKKLEELERKRLEEIERKKRQEKVKELVEKAKEAVKEKQVAVAEALFSKILEMDPENFDVPQLKIELDAWKKEQDRIAVEAAQKEAERKRKVGLIQPSKGYFLKKDWYKAILKLEEFLKIKDMDEDLVKEATEMLETSKKELKSIVDPLIGKARSLKEGQDLKGAYENYLEILDFDPVNTEALNEMDEIRLILENRSKKIYREAIISESLSLFDDAKEKFQEVQQISPTDSDYYKKATNKLKEYLD